MSFLDNSGDIILDVVLTDAGRARLARGDGSFQVTKFALGDDEINYELYNKNDSRGSAYYDVDILQAPVFEAFSDNGASLKHKLISLPRRDLLYLPILKLNEVVEGGATSRRTSGGSVGTFVVPVDSTIESSFNPENGIMLGENPADGGVYIRVDQGLDTTEISPNRALDDNLVETRYIVELDSRFASVVSKAGDVRARPSYIDDDFISSYNFALGSDTDFVMENNVKNAIGQTISGPRGTYLQFKLQSSLDLNSSTFFFTQLGSQGTITDLNGNSVNIYYIDTIIKIIGATTGRSVDVPVRYIKNR